MTVVMPLTLACLLTSRSWRKRFFRRKRSATATTRATARIMLKVAMSPFAVADLEC